MPRLMSWRSTGGGHPHTNSQPETGAQKTSLHATCAVLRTDRAEHQSIALYTPVLNWRQNFGPANGLSRAIM